VRERGWLACILVLRDASWLPSTCVARGQSSDREMDGSTGNEGDLFLVFHITPSDLRLNYRFCYPHLHVRVI
jgi:hypothetical protein